MTRGRICEILPLTIHLASDHTQYDWPQLIGEPLLESMTLSFNRPRGTQESTNGNKNA